MDSLIQDVRLGLRQLRSSPGFTAVAVVTLGLGIGANTAIFGVIDGVLLDPFPYEDSAGILVLNEKLVEDDLFLSVAYPNFVDWREQNQVFEHLAATRGSAFNLVGADEPIQVRACLVSADVFPLLGIEPALGRVFGAEEDTEGAERVVVLSHALWQSAFGGARSVLGRSIRLDDQ